MMHDPRSTSPGMPVIFFSSTATPLYSAALTPANGAQYAGLCVFVVALSVFARLLIAARGVIDNQRWRSEKRGPSMLALLEKALFDVVVAAVGYLLMLVVMTMNVGYFCSVLGGVFIGAVISGNWGREQHEGDWMPC